MRHKVSRRVSDLRKHGKGSSPAVKSAVQRGYVAPESQAMPGTPDMTGRKRRKPVSKMTRSQMNKEYADLTEWTKQETSTIRGMRRFERRIDDLLKESTELDAEDESEIFALRDQLVAEFPTIFPHIRDMKHRLNSEQILERISTLYQSKLSKDEILATMRSELNDVKIEQQEGAKRAYGFSLRVGRGNYVRNK